jgi:elongation factor G
VCRESISLFFSRLTIRPIGSRIDVVESDEIPSSVLELAKAKRNELVEQLAEVDEEMADLFLNDEQPSNSQLTSAIRRATVGLKFSPVFLGSAIKNTAVQPLLDGVCAYLPNPSESEVVAHDTSLPTSAPPVPLVPASAAPLVGLAFKLEEGRFGQLTYMRVYQGSLKKGSAIYNARTGRKTKVPRLVRMHSNEMEVRFDYSFFAIHLSVEAGYRLNWPWGNLCYLRC